MNWNVFSIDKLIKNFRYGVQSLILKYFYKKQYHKSLQIIESYIKKYKTDYVLLYFYGKTLIALNNINEGNNFLRLARFYYEKLFNLKSARFSLELPFKKGEIFLCVQGNNTDITHIGFDKYAWDFSKVNSNFSPVKENPAISNESFYSFGSKLYSPIEGRVISVVNNIDDNEYGKIGYYPNLLIIEHNSGYRVHLIHFKKNSILVKPREIIKIGTELGEIGNSGASKSPHLHIMVTDQKNISVSAVFKMVKKYNFRKKSFEIKKNYVPERGNYYLGH
jgi:murein DD-endopeptidase MepM/ murein hydrolase activator NlpD